MRILTEELHARKTNPCPEKVFIPIRTKHCHFMICPVTVNLPPGSWLINPSKSVLLELSVGLYRHVSHGE